MGLCTEEREKGDSPAQIRQQKNNGYIKGSIRISFLIRTDHTPSSDAQQHHSIPDFPRLLFSCRGRKSIAGNMYVGLAVLCHDRECSTESTLRLLGVIGSLRSVSS